jgi:excisionase family DNA binding protein
MTPAAATGQPLTVADLHGRRPAKPRPSSRFARHAAEWLTVSEAAAELGVSRRTVSRLLDAGEIPYSVPSKQRRIRRADLLAHQRGRLYLGAAALPGGSGEDVLRD